ncbi:MAG TPA: hypothetical protein VFP34_05770, partial [Microlunatus sp.]|nr:hypothetical protein [Microlunatus sp.]
MQLSAAGHQVDLLPAPTWRGVPSDLEAYGRWTADRISASGRPVDLLIGLSVGTQAAAVAAGLADVRQLL